MIATETFLGVHPSTQLPLLRDRRAGRCLLQGRHEPGRASWPPDRYVARCKAGSGAAKTAGNFAASLFGAEEAQKAGYTQVLGLDGVEHRYLDEVGTMNIMLKIDDEVITPPLNGAILGRRRPRDSGADPAARLGHARLRAAGGNRRSPGGGARPGGLEMWGTGTAGGDLAGGRTWLQGERYVIGDGRTGR